MNKLSPLTIIIFIVILLSALAGSRFSWVLLVAYGLFILFSRFNLLEKLQSLNQSSMPHTIDIKNSFAHGLPGAKKFILGVLGLIVVISILAASIVVVEAGETGVYSLFGKVRDQELSSGIHLINPLAKVTPLSIRTEEYTMSIVTGEGKRSGDDSIAALTKEGLNVELDITALYRLSEDSASDIYRTVGLDYNEKVVRPSIRSAIREVIAQYEAKDIYSEKRQEAARQIFAVMERQLEDRGIIMESILLRNVELPPLLAQAIQEKLTAEQETEKYNFLLEKEKKEAARKIIEAEGQREAQAIINQSLTTNYLYYLYVKELKDRQGTIYVPVSPTSGLPLFRGVGN